MRNELRARFFDPLIGTPEHKNQAKKKLKSYIVGLIRQRDILEELLEELK